MSTGANESTSGRLRRYIPILTWLPTYHRAWLAADIIAGLTLWGLVVAEAMAYAGVAGLPPQMRRYTLLASLLVCALFGSLRHLVMRATSATAALLASSVAGVLVAVGLVEAGAVPDAATIQAYASAFVLRVGLVFLVAAIARLGFITQFSQNPSWMGLPPAWRSLSPSANSTSSLACRRARAIRLRNSQLYYANALTVRDQVKSLVERAGAPLRAVIFDAAAQDSLDITSSDVLKGLIKELRTKDWRYRPPRCTNR